MAIQPNAGQTEYDAWLEQLRAREWTMHDVPFYREGVGPNVADWHNLDYLDFYDKVYGRRIGSNGIGKLKEVALTRIEKWERATLFDQDPAWFAGAGISKMGAVDVGKMRAQQEHYAGVLEENGVKVHWIEYPNPPVSAFGPMVGMWAAQELLIINGGSVIPRIGWFPFSFGRAEYLARWAFWHLGIPPLLTITGKGVNEAGASFFLAQDVFLTALSPSYNREGLEQLIPVMRRTAGIEPFHVQVMHLSATPYFNPKTGACSHPDVLVGPLDIKKAVLFTAGIDTETYLWLKHHGYKLVELDFEEHVQHFPANLTILEPGRVIMAAEAPKAVAEVRKLGVDVIEVPYSEFHKAGGGFACSTQLILREPGPALLS